MQQLDSSPACFSHNFNRFLLDELWVAHQAARQERKATVDQRHFETNTLQNLIALRDAIVRQNYHLSQDPAGHPIYDTITQTNIAAPFRDRIVHHLLVKTCADWWSHHFLPDAYACHKSRGTLYNQKRLIRHLCRATQGYTRPAFAMKFSIPDCHRRLSHEKLIKRTLWGLEQQFYHTNLPDPLNHITCLPQDREALYQTLEYLWQTIIRDQPRLKSTAPRVHSRHTPTSRSPRSTDYGILSHDATSALLTNIFLDQLDRFIITKLKYGHYGRYKSEFFIMVPISQKDQLLSDIKVIQTFLQTELELSLQPCKHNRHDQGNVHSGTVIHPRLIQCTGQSCHNYYRSAYQFPAKSLGSIEDMISCLNSNQHADTRRFFHHLFNTFGWNY